ncbi:MAG TPA: hypothetical protein EYP65_06285, partial [Armatimonadetes bacterium]|nr:hypothetical protein [Armatimonadota bacterium]
RALVLVAVEGKVVAQGQADEQGRYLFPRILLREGENTLEVVAKKGRLTTRRVLKVVVDTHPPEVELLRPSDGAVLKGPDVVVEGRTEPGSEVTVLVEGKPAGSTSADLKGHFRLVAKGIEPGRRTLRVVARDRAGNSGFTEVRVTVDTAPPSLDILSPRVGEVIPKKSLYVRGFTEPGATVIVRVGGVEVGRDVARKDGAFKVGPVIFEAEGRALISVTARDRAGWTRTVERFVEVDFTPPPIEVRFPPPGEAFKGPRGELVVLTEPAARVRLRRGKRVVAEALADERGLAVISGIPLLPGSNKFTIEASDRAGHTRQREVVLLYDRTEGQLRRLGYPERIIKAVEEGSKVSLEAEFK